MATGFKDRHPFVNMMFFISVIVFGMLNLHPVCLFISVTAALAYDVRLKGKKAAKEIFFFLLPMILFFAILKTLFAHYGLTVLYERADGNNITFEAINYGFVTGLSAVSVIAWFFCMNEIMTADKLMCVFGKGFAKTALVISMALRFVPLYRKKYAQIAQARRGMDGSESGNFFAKIKNSLHCTSILITWALENAIETSDSMHARGYGSGKRTSYSRFRMTPTDYAGIAAMILFDAIIIIAKIKGELYASYNPYIIINPAADFGTTYLIKNINLVLNPFSPLCILALAAYALLCFMPFIIDVKEDMQWKKSISKI